MTKIYSEMKEGFSSLTSYSKQLYLLILQGVNSGSVKLTKKEFQDYY